MIGRVSAHEALMDVAFRFDHRPDFVAAFVIDTGFAGHLTLPPAAVEALRLPFLWDSGARLADDSVIDVAIFAATILWDGHERAVEVLATGARPLLGTSLLDGYELNVRFAEDGIVSVESLKPLHTRHGSRVAIGSVRCRSLVAAQYVARPPEISKTAPVLNEQSSEASHATSAATSSG